MKCTACARYCTLGDGQIGLCGIRQNIGGKLFLLSYGKLFTGHIDPIEKKPVSHYHPGTKIFSVATSGCNWLCRYCFHPNTVVLTDRGLTEIEELFQSGRLIKDSQLEGISRPEGVKAISHKGQLQEIEAVFKHHYQGPMITVVPFYLPAFSCTPNHNVLATTDPNSEPVMVRADRLSKGYYLAIPKLRRGESSDTIDIKQALLSVNRGVRRLTNQGNSKNLRIQIVQDLKNGMGIRQIARKHVAAPSQVSVLARRYHSQGEEAFINGYSIYTLPEIGETIKFSGGKHKGVPRYVRLDERLAWLLGIYCAEGSVIESPNRPNSSVLTFSFGRHETDLIHKTQLLLKDLFLETAIVVTQGSVTRLQVGNSTLAKVVKGLAGGDCYSKKVPDRILLSRSPSITRSFVSGYLAGDGYYTLTKRANYGVVGSTSVSRVLSLGVAYCMLGLQSTPRVYASSGNKTVSIMGRTVNRSRDHLVRLLVKDCRFDAESIEWEELSNQSKETENFILIPIRRIDRVAYEGPVYNLQVSEDHTYTASFFAVSNCQNYDISQRRKIEGFDIEPAEVPRLALAQDCQGIAYTYNEPTIFIEFARDIGIEAHKKGLFNIFVSNGFDTPDGVRMLDEFLDCITVDFKGSGETNFVRKYIGIPGAEPIFETLLALKKSRVHVEITDLIVPQAGDSLEAAKKLTKWVYDNLGPEMPIHFLRFHPDYKMMEFPSTPIKTLEAHHKIAKEAGLKYVYLGNVPGHPLEHTYCPECNNIVVKRYSFDITGWFLDEKNNCKFCGAHISIEGGLASTVSDERFLPAYF